VPLALPGTFTYRVPDSLQNKVMVGKRAVVQFGSQRLYSGIIIKLKDETEFSNTKEILDIVDEQPVILDIHLRFWKWLSEYYLCSMGEVMHAALPTGIKFDSETKFSLLNESDDVFHSLNDEEHILVEALKHRSFSLQEIQKLLNKKTVYPVIKKLLNEGVITGDEILRNQFKPKIEKYLQLKSTITEEELKSIVFTSDKRLKKQVEILQEIIHLSDISPLILKKELTDKFPNCTSSLNKLMEKGLLEEVLITKDRLEDENKILHHDILLSQKQINTCKNIKALFQQHDVVLLHGVTSSGKTHIYLKLIEETISTGKQALYLLPEIALTAQIIKKLKSYFGNQVGIYHSKFNANERVEIWNKTLSGEYKVVLGVRSSIFLPFQNLGLIVVDEEHDGSYKQQDPAPRYHARDAAIVLAQMTDAKVLLGTATPSLESYHNATEGKYGLVEMADRHGGSQLPETVVVNMKEAARKKKTTSHFSETLLNEIETSLNQKEQVILFQNRRGYVPYIQCNDCSWSPKCKNCDVSLTYHKYFNKLKCHYCGYTEKNPERCASCGSHTLKMQGIGTEKIEDEISVLFPKAKLDRLDLEAARGKDAHNKIIQKFEHQETDILVGTQMVTKGLDFDHVRLVGIINVDSLLNYPDFRSGERTYQLIEQVSGRAGRKDKKGFVVLQCSRPENPVVQYATVHDYKSFFQSEMEMRRQFFYPPYSRIINITLKHKDRDTVHQAANTFLKLLSLDASIKKFGPFPPLISRIKNLYLQDIVLKIPRQSALLKKTKAGIIEAVNLLHQNVLLKSVQVHVDVDPL
jgi:primosomal protein N' (replication factor Y) (superfamily II helicase)